MSTLSETPSEHGITATVNATATSPCPSCRCRDLRRALLGLWRANLTHADSELTEQFLRSIPGEPWPKELASAHALRRSMRRARRLLRETRNCTGPFVLERPNVEAAALKRIIEAWLTANNANTPHEAFETQDALYVILRSVAREFGFGGEGGGK